MSAVRLLQNLVCMVIPTYLDRNGFVQNTLADLLLIILLCSISLSASWAVYTLLIFLT